MKIVSWNQDSSHSRIKAWKEIEKIQDKFIKINGSDIISMQEACIL